jgi:hypothetical protein
MTRPESTFSSPEITPSSVLLPEPDLPMMAVKLPAGTEKSTPRRISSVP